MNKQALYIAGGALLASTALSTSAMAVSIKTLTAPTLGTFTAPSVATQIFPSSAASAVVLGPQTFTVDTDTNYSTKFNILLSPANAKFSSSTTPSATGYRLSNTASVAGAGASALICSVTPGSDTMLITCDPTTSVMAVTAVLVTGVTYNNAAALAAASAAVSVTGTVRDSSNTVTFETLAATNMITSKSAGSIAASAGTTFTADNTATVPFSTLSNGTTTTSAKLTSVSFNTSAAVMSDLTTASTQTMIFSTTEVKLTHGVVSDTAVTRIDFAVPGGGAATVSLTKSVGQFGSGFVTFSPTGAGIATPAQGWDLTVYFNGSTGISASSGTVTVTPTANTNGGASAATFTPVAALSNQAVTSISRGGLSTEINTAIPSTQTGFTSFLRITNNGTFAGPVTITVYNDETGAQIGSAATTVSIPAKGTLQVSSADVEAGNATKIATTGGAGITSALLSGVNALKFVVSGSINGYVQHILYNSTTGQVADLSSFRNGAIANANDP